MYTQSLAIPTSDFYWDSDRRRGFDPLGRLVLDTHVEEYIEGGQLEVFVNERTYIYDCP